MVRKSKQIPDKKRLKGSDSSFCVSSFDIVYGKKVIIENSRLIIEHGQRYGLIGKNGTGKSTLLRLIGNDLSPTCPNLKVGFYHQHFETSLPFDLNPVDYLMSLNENVELTLAHKYLSMFGLEPINR